MKRRTLVAMMTGVALFGLIIAALSIALLPRLNTAHASNGLQSMRGDNGAATTINNLHRISVVGSTAFIVDGHGRTIATDANPYGVAIAPNNVPASNTAGSLKPGDILVTNIGGNDTGTTIVRFPAGKGPGLLFNPMPGPKGPAMEAFNTLSGTDWIANVSANNVQVFKPNGKIGRASC